MVHRSIGARARPFVLAVVALTSVPLAAGTLAVSSLDPAARSMTATPGNPIAVTFDRPVDRTTVIARDTFWAFGRWSGTIDGTFSYADGDRTVILTPKRSLLAGENVMVVLSSSLAAADGSPLRSAGYSYQFRVASGPSDLQFTEAARISTRTLPGQTSRAYGGLATDLDVDGFADLTIVNEDTNDLRIFINQADGSGLFDPFLVPTEPTGSVPSPSEPADFDRDGVPDVAVANTGSNSVSILLGNGDGTFGPHQEIGTGGQARGIAVLDVDGDGDVDVAVSSDPAGDFALLFNDGNGTFGAPQQFGTGAGLSWGLGAADMNEDGILDLVVGDRDGDSVAVWTGNGDGSLSAQAPHDAGGRVWMLVIGDVNGDGHEDVSAANSSTNNGAILLGDGAGGFARPVTHATDPFPLATDLGDLDGDGDLDWIVASFGGDWSLFLNDGAGTFTFDREFPAPQAASCSLMVDMDNDGDLDLALIDELEDEVIVLHNSGSALFADGFESGDTSAWFATVP